MQGLQPFQVWDETYVHTKINPDKTVLMERVDAKGREPWTLVRSDGKGKVFYTAFGHDPKEWKDEKFQKHLFGGVKWATGELAGDAKPSGPKK